MKLIHCADIHLGSPLESVSDSEKRKQRQSELRSAFSRLVDRAAELGVSAILISGDLFDRERPYKKDKEFFYSVVASHPDIDFLYLKGNHDYLESYTENIQNLKLFSESWQSYTYGDVTVSGTELSQNNCTSLYSSYVPGDTRFNIVMLHGNLSDTTGPEHICRRLFADRGINYLALGHYHSFKAEKIDAVCSAVYCGCLEGRGYDEPGDHGFVLIDTDSGALCYEFIPNSQRRIVKFETDISDISDDYTLISRIREHCGARDCDMLRVELTGKPAADTKSLAAELRTQLASCYWDVSVKDRSTVPLTLGDYRTDVSLRGEFIRTVMEDTTLSDEERELVLSAGLRVLAGEEAGI